MNRTTKRLTAILLALCLLFGGVGLAPEIASTSGSLIAKAKVKKYTRYVKTCTADVYATTGSAATVVKTLKRNKKVAQYGGAKKGWAKISYASGETGYIRSKNLSKKKISLLKAAKEENKMLRKLAYDKYGWGDWCNDAHNPDPGYNSMFRVGFLNLRYKIWGFATRVKGSEWVHYNVTVVTYPAEDMVLKKKNVTATTVAKLIKKYNDIYD